MKSDSAKDPGAEPAAPLTMDVLARQQGVEPLASADELRAEIWESDEELDAFLAEVRRSRDADLA